jgi:hypothetical protein
MEFVPENIQIIYDRTNQIFNQLLEINFENFKVKHSINAYKTVRVFTYSIATHDMILNLLQRLPHILPPLSLRA